MGLFGNVETVSGIMITPACDVTNYKTETLTYIPVITLEQYFATIGFLPIIRREILDRISSASVNIDLQWAEKGYDPPSQAALDECIAKLKAKSEDKTVSNKHKAHLERATAGLRVAKICASSDCTTSVLQDVAILFGSNWSAIREKIVTNAYRTDIHFLPASGGDSKVLEIESHSVAMFRYPTTVPAEILTSAQIIGPSQWQEHLQIYSKISSATKFFSSAQPLKILTLKSAFLADFLTRFTGLYSRIGSPDFSDATITKICGEII